MSPPRRRLVSELTGTAMVAVIGLTVMGVTLALGGASPRAHAITIGIVGGVLALVVAAAARRRLRALERLEGVAARVLGADLAQADAAEFDSPPPVDDAPGDLAALTAALDGLAIRVEAQMKDLAKKTRNLEALIDAIDEPILATDDAERVLLCNRSAERLLDQAGAGPIGPGGPGARATPLLGRPITQVFTQAAILEMHAAARAGQTRRDRVRVTTPLGVRVFQVTASPVPVAWGRGIFGAVIALRDVTELDQAVQVQTDFVANASHELRTPVSSIRGAAETLQGIDDDPKMSEKLRSMILTNAVRLEEMLRDLLDLSRLDSPDAPVTLEPIDLSRLEDDIRALSEEHCRERRLSLEWTLAPNTPALRSDRKLLTLIVRNLVENATKFAHEGTVIRVNIGPMATVGSRPPEGVRISVQDQGIGIPLAHQERVFERYFQVDPGRGSMLRGWRRGTGLGLAIVKAAAAALGGRPGINSVYGQGTTAYVDLPLMPDAPAGGGPQRPRGERPDATNPAAMPRARAG